MPSTAITMSAVFEPCTLMLYCPSTKGVTVVPGRSNARAGVLRIGVGIWSRMSRSTTNCAVLLLTSTVGVPDTVMVSSSVPTCICSLTGAENVPWIRMPSRRTVLNPVSVKVTAYMPGGRSTMR